VRACASFSRKSFLLAGVVRAICGYLPVRAFFQSCCAIKVIPPAPEEVPEVLHRRREQAGVWPSVSENPACPEITAAHLIAVTNGREQMDRFE
jgi:hypothetical protein